MGSQGGVGQWKDDCRIRRGCGETAPAERAVDPAGSFRSTVASVESTGQTLSPYRSITTASELEDAVRRDQEGPFPRAGLPVAQTGVCC